MGNVVFGALLLLLVLAAAAYGAADPSWKSFLTSLIFAVGALAAIELGIKDQESDGGWTNDLLVLLPVVILIAFSLAQTIPSPRSSGASFAISYRLWNSISADPYETRVFAMQLTGLVLLAGLLFRYLTTERRLRMLINVIIGIALASALFGLLRQTMQHEDGFLLPLLKLDQGYGQFINRNHFAYLMEMALGLILGMAAGGGVRRDRFLIYLGAFLPIWTALVLANSRGGILAMVVQLIATLLLFPAAVPIGEGNVGRLLRSPGSRLALIAVLVILVAGGVLWVGGDRLATRIEAARGEFAESDELRLGVTRTQIWRATLRMIEANPIAGVGLGGYWAAIPSYHEAPGSMTPQQAHNDYLELLASGGILGFSLVVWFAVLALRRARANLRAPERIKRAACLAALIGIAGVAAHSLVDFGLHRMSIAMIFTALLVIATTSNVRVGRNRQRSDA